MPYLSTQPLKGFRDFPPESWQVQKYLFKVCETVAEKYNFKEYNGPILEDINIYNKSGGDIGTLGKDLYAFTDRGGRNIAIRPEMTPTVGRMVAAYSKSYPKPLKWFSIAQFFRSENPQKGRGREFFQFNADIFGEQSINADYECIALAVDILKAFGADSTMFKVYVNSRSFMNYFFKEVLNINDAEVYSQITKFLDAKAKNPAKWFEDSCKKYLNDEQFEKLLNLLDNGQSYLNSLNPESNQDLKDFSELLSKINASSLAEYCVFDPSIARGFDYYTGMVFEVFDVNPENPRSLFGGGRYNDLTNLFGSEKIPAVGFAVGDMTLRLFLEGWKLLNANTDSEKNLVYIPVLVDSVEAFTAYNNIASAFRSKGFVVQLGLKLENISKAMSFAYKIGANQMVIAAEEEFSAQNFKLKDLTNKEEKTLPL